MGRIEAREGSQALEVFSQIENRYLSPVEQKMIGSSVAGFDVTGELAQHQGSLPLSRFRPDSIVEGDSIEATNIQRKSKYLIGSLAIFGLSSLLVPDELLQVTRLPLADPITGIPPQEWVTFLVNSGSWRVYNDPDLLSQLGLSGRIGSQMFSWVEGDGVHASFKPNT